MSHADAHTNTVNGTCDCLEHAIIIIILHVHSYQVRTHNVVTVSSGRFCALNLTGKLMAEARWMNGGKGTCEC